MLVARWVTAVSDRGRRHSGIQGLTVVGQTRGLTKSPGDSRVFRADSDLFLSYLHLRIRMRRNSTATYQTNRMLFLVGYLHSPVIF